MCKNDIIKLVNGRNHMTEEEKRFKILKRTSYKELKEKESKKLTKAAFWTGVTSAFVVIGIYGMSNFETSVIGLFNGCIYSAWTVGNLKNVIEAICKRTMYESKIEDIDRELEMLELNEKRGMRR